MIYFKNKSFSVLLIGCLSFGLYGSQSPSLSRLEEADQPQMVQARPEKSVCWADQAGGVLASIHTVPMDQAAVEARKTFGRSGAGFDDNAMGTGLSFTDLLKIGGLLVAAYLVINNQEAIKQKMQKIAQWSDGHDASADSKGALEAQAMIHSLLQEAEKREDQTVSAKNAPSVIKKIPKKNVHAK